MNKKTKANQKIQAWIDARKRHRLSDAEVQMARELGMNPTKLGSVDNHRQEPWKMPLKDFIAHLYRKQFGRERPESVLSLEEKLGRDMEKKTRRRKARLQRLLVEPRKQPITEPDSTVDDSSRDDVDASDAGNMKSPR